MVDLPCDCEERTLVDQRFGTLPFLRVSGSDPENGQGSVPSRWGKWGNFPHLGRGDGEKFPHLGRRVTIFYIDDFYMDDVYIDDFLY